MCVRNIAVGLTITEEDGRWTPKQVAVVCGMMVKIATMAHHGVRQTSKAVKEGRHASQVN